MISLMGGSTKSFLPQGDKVQTFLFMLLITLKNELFFLNKYSPAYILLSLPVILKYK